MDWSALSRFTPEVAVLAVGGYYSLQAIKMFKEILDSQEKKSQKSYNKLSKAIDKNTESNKELIKASKEQHDFMKNLNGKLTKATSQTIREHE